MLTSAVFAAITALVIAVTNITVMGRDHAEAITGARQVVNTVGRSVSSAAALNEPVTHSGNYYFEYLTTATGPDEAALCTQWRYTPKTGRLHWRTWDVLRREPTSWQLAAEHVTNDTTNPIFTVTDLGGNFATPLVTVALTMTTPNGTTAHSEADFAAQNIDTTSTLPICEEVTRS